MRGDVDFVESLRLAQVNQQRHAGECAEAQGGDQGEIADRLECLDLEQMRERRDYESSVIPLVSLAL